MDNAYSYHGIEKGMACQDIRVAIFTKYMSDELAMVTNNHELDIIETEPPYPRVYNDKTEYTGQVFPTYPYSDTNTSKSMQAHAKRVVDILRGGATEAKIYVFHLDSDYALKWCADNKILSINTSWSNDGISDEATEYAYDKGLLMFTSAGNQGKKDNPDLTPLAKTQWFYSVGSIHFKDGKLIVPSYASEGEELDYCAIGGMFFSDGVFRNGSSYSSPMKQLMIMQYAQRSYDFFGRMPKSRDRIERFIDRNLTDVGKIGFDIETGNGIMTLPSDWRRDFINDAECAMDYYILKAYPDGLGKERRDRLIEMHGPEFWKKARVTI